VDWCEDVRLMSHRSARPRPMLSNVTPPAKRQAANFRVLRRWPLVPAHPAPSPPHHVASIWVVRTARASSAPGMSAYTTKRTSDSIDVDVEHCWILDHRTSKCERARRNAIARQVQTLTSDFCTRRSTARARRAQRARSADARSYIPSSRDVRDPDGSFRAEASALGPLRGSTSHG
jgi:hypothetical protein